MRKPGGDQNSKNDIKSQLENAFVTLCFSLGACGLVHHFGNLGDESQGKRVRAGRLLLMALIIVLINIPCQTRTLIHSLGR